jgi:nucleoside-diphosphate-sugar epimerase
MKVFVTGASGFVGGAAVRALIAGGHQVRAMSRREESDVALRAMGAEPVRCDLESITAEHIGSATAVLHCAAFVAPWGPKDAWYRDNVLGTRAVLAAALAAGAKRFIHIGTEAALVHGQDLVDADESCPLAPNSPYPYCATKAQAEALVLAANEEGFTTISLRPRFIWGPGDTTLLPIIETMAAEGKWMWVNKGNAMTSTTHIDNLVAAILLAMDKGRGGQAYFVLDDGRRTLREIITGMAAAKGLTLPNRSIPRWLADTLGFVCEGLWRLFRLRSEPPLTRHAAMVMSRNCTLVDAKARRELGYVPVISVEQGLAAMRETAE